MPQQTADAVLERSGGICEEPNCPGPDWRGYQFCHIQNRGMGGRHGEMEKAIHDKRNVAYLCAPAHDIIDNRVKSAFRDFLTRYLKKKIDWYDWREEHSV